MSSSESETEYQSASDVEEEDDVPVEGAVGEVVQPYRFEPAVREGPAAEAMEVEQQQQQRAGNTEWCTCLVCQPTDVELESYCCHEADPIARKLAEYNEEFGEELECITQHPGFRDCCLSRWSLELGYEQYKQKYGELRNFRPDEKKRFIGYRQLVTWCWGYLGRYIRVQLPTCALQLIRRTNPSPDEQYRHFSWYQNH